MSKKILLNLVLVVASITLAIALVEVVLHFMEAREEISYQSLTRGDAIDLRAMNYNTDAVPRHKSAAMPYRVLSFGDSFAYTIVKTEFTYHSIAARTASALSGKPAEIVNLGEPAISFYQYMNAYRSFGRALDHDAVIFNIYLGNDLLDVAYKYVADDVKINRLFGKLTLDLQTGEARNTGIPSKFPLRVMDYGYAVYLSLTGKIKPAAKQSKPGQYNFAVAELAEDAWLDHINVQLDNFDPKKLPALGDGYVAAIQFARFVKEIGASGKPVLILLSPNQSQVDSAVLEKVARKYNRNTGELDLDLSARLISRIFKDIAPEASVLYLRPALFCAAQKGPSFYYKTDTHWSAEGNQTVGGFVGTWLAQHWFGAAAKPAGDCAESFEPRGMADADQLYDSNIKPLLLSAPKEGRIR